MVDEREVICVTCPKGCHAQVWEADGAVHIKGQLCKKGKPYVEQEYREPRRVLTTTVMVEGSRVNRLPVRTSAAIPKKDLLKGMAVLSKIIVRPAVRIGDVIVADITSGVDVVASDDLLQ